MNDRAETEVTWERHRHMNKGSEPAVTWQRHVRTAASQTGFQSQCAVALEDLSLMAPVLLSVFCD